MYGGLHNARIRGQAVLDYVMWRLCFRDCALANKQFSINDCRYSYFVHPYNRTWDNERAVEMPLVLDCLRQAKGKDVLEVGNVVSHYIAATHDVIDKYETAALPTLIRADVLEFNPRRQYDVIISISTVEHVGWDEVPKHPEKVLCVVPKIRTMLRECGGALITWPVGYNDFLDAATRRGDMGFSAILCLRRVSRANEWVEVGINEVMCCEYGRPYPRANGIIVGTIGMPCGARDAAGNAFAAMD